MSFSWHWGNPVCPLLCEQGHSQFGPLYAVMIGWQYFASSRKKWGSERVLRCPASHTCVRSTDAAQGSPTPGSLHVAWWVGEVVTSQPAPPSLPVLPCCFLPLCSGLAPRLVGELLQHEPYLIPSCTPGPATLVEWCSVSADWLNGLWPGDGSTPFSSPIGHWSSTPGNVVCL